jgi:hypothetical protein
MGYKVVYTRVRAHARTYAHSRRTEVTSGIGSWENKQLLLSVK